MYICASACCKCSDGCLLARCECKERGVVPNSAPCQIMHPPVLVGLGVGVGEGLGWGWD